MTHLKFDLLPCQAQRLQRLADSLGVDLETCLGMSLRLLNEAVEEVIEGRVISSVPPPQTFHDWNLGAYDAQPHRVLMS